MRHDSPLKLRWVILGVPGDSYKYRTSTSSFEPQFPKLLCAIGVSGSPMLSTEDTIERDRRDTVLDPDHINLWVASGAPWTAVHGTHGEIPRWWPQNSAPRAQSPEPPSPVLSCAILYP